MISNLLSYAKKCHDPIPFFHVNPQLFIAIFFIVTTCDFLPVTVRLFYHLNLLVLYLSLHHHSFHKTSQKSCYKDVTDEG